MHTLSFAPDAESGHCILVVTGGRINEIDEAYAAQLRDLSQLPVATLYDIPNQPVFDLTEDDLIAFTFDRALQTGDLEWALLVPMVASVVQAMNALEEAGLCAPGTRFLLTGMSKRAWTVWLAAACDQRVSAIAPLVFDNLNMAEQMRAQMATWGRFSEMLAPYIARGLPQRASEPDVLQLAALVDPYSYRERLTQPALVVLGANDPYWTVDAHSLYAASMPSQPQFYIQPNAGHGLAGGQEALVQVADFFAAVARAQPQLALEFRSDGAKTQDGSDAEWRLWRAFAPDLVFSEATWQAEAIGVGPSAKYPDAGARSGTAWLLEARVGAVRRSAPVRLFRQAGS